MATSSSHDVRSGSLVTTLAWARGLLELFPTWLLALAFRLAVATVFWRSGLTKIASWDATVALFDMEYMLPLLPPVLGAYLATTVELSCSLLLALGLATRIAAAALLGMTLVIQLFVYPENWPDHLLWGSILAYLLTRGPGVISVDCIVWWRLFGVRHDSVVAIAMRPRPSRLKSNTQTRAGAADDFVQELR